MHGHNNLQNGNLQFFTTLNFGNLVQIIQVLKQFLSCLRRKRGKLALTTSIRALSIIIQNRNPRDISPLYN